MAGYRDSVSGFTRGLGGFIAGALNIVAEPVSDLVETVGHALQDALDNIGGALGGIPKVGGFFRGLIRWVGGIVGGVCIVFAAAVKGVLGAAGWSVGGVIRVVGGILSLRGGEILVGLGDVASGALGAIVVPGGKAIGLVQTALFLQVVERRLTKEEVAMLKPVFRGSLALYNLRMVAGRSGLWALNERPFTLGNTIIMKARDPKAEPKTVVHESTHAWQYRHVGARYATDALGAQMALPDSYDWEAEIKRGNAEWTAFNKEGQAQLVEDAWDEGERTTSGVTTTGTGAFFGEDGPQSTNHWVHNGVDQTDRANRALKVLRGAAEVRLSAVFS